MTTTTKENFAKFAKLQKEFNLPDSSFVSDGFVAYIRLGRYVVPIYHNMPELRERIRWHQKNAKGIYE